MSSDDVKTGILTPDVKIEVPRPISQVATDAITLLAGAIAAMDDGTIDAETHVLFVVDRGSPLVHPRVANTPGTGPIVFASSKSEVATSFAQEPGFLAAIAEPFECGHRPLAVVASQMTFGVVCPRCFLASERAASAKQLS